MSSLLIKNIIFGVSCLAVYLALPSFIGLSNKCIFINLGVIIYVAFSVIDLYDFFKGDKFSIGIQMYRIKSLAEDGSKFNIWHRRVGAVVRVILAVVVLMIAFNQWFC